MRTFYTSMLVIHVLFAIFGVGLVGSVALVASTARRNAQRSVDAAALLSPLLRYSALSLAVMLVSGVLLNVAAGGAFGPRWWFRASVLLLVATGILHGQTRRTLRTGLAAEGAGDAALHRIERNAYLMAALVAVITVLMEAKPF